jgi:hypothetical protein
MVLLAALDDVMAAVEPFERDGAGHHADEGRMRRLGGPGADHRRERLHGGISLGHVRRDWDWTTR